ncbi:MAG: IPT/TIG domain-containing protein [Acidimicrobiales bacterium]
MNNPRRIQRHLVKALAASALLAAAALPMAIATSAGATTPATIAFTTTSPTTATNQPGLVDYGAATSGTFTITAASGTFAGTGTPTFTTTDSQLTFTGTTESSTGSVGGTFSSAAGLTPGSYTVTAFDTTDTGGTPVTFSVAGAQTILFDTSANGCGGSTDGAYFGSGACGTFDLIDTTNAPFAGDGGSTTVTTTAPGVTFSGLTNTTGDTITGSFASTSATVPGTYSVTVKDNAGTETYTNVFTVYGDPTVTGVENTATSTSSASDSAPGTVVPIKLTGADFVSPISSIIFTSTVDGTTLAATAITGGGTETAPATSITASLELVNTNNGAQATPGTYTVTIENPDGGSSTSGALFTVIGNEVSTVSPSAIPNAATTSPIPITINGNGFDSTATVTFDGACADATLGTPLVTSSSSISDTISLSAAPGLEQCSILVTNVDTGASFEGVDAIGVGEASDVAPVITASSLSASAAILAGAPSTLITLTGTGFSSFTTAGPTLVGATSAIDPDAVITQTAGACIANSAGTSLTCPIVVNSGATAGAHTAVLVNDTAKGEFPGAFIVDGPAITSAAPAALAIGAPIGTVVALTGTGFNNTSAFVGAGITGSTGLAASLQYSSATTENLVVTSSPTAIGNATFAIQTTDAYGAAEVSAPFVLPVQGAPSVSSITYVTGTTGVGVGATAQPVTINGTGFLTGATVSAFTNASGTADSAVKFTVTSVNNLGTQIVGTVAITSPDTNTIDGYTVTNTNGGTAKALAVAPAGLVIDAAPTISAVSPVSATPSSTNAFTITGTGFESGAAVTLSSDGTCGAATVASATSITVSCTLGAASATAVTLSVSNPDGGTATSGTILAATKPAPSFHVGAVHGSAVSGKTVTLTVSGTGFYGQPHVTSTAAGSKIGVTKDTGTLLTLRVTTRAHVSGEHTFTITLANGKSGKANYSIKK